MSGVRLVAIIITLIIAGIIMLAQIKEYKAGNEAKEQVVTKVKEFEESYKKSMDEAMKKTEDRMNERVNQYGK
jgi:hypothetical protein